MKDKNERSKPAGAGTTGAPVELSTGRKLLFGFVGFVLLPLLALVAVELILRLVGAGYDPSFFKRITIDGERFLVENDRFGLRFFPPELARSPAPIVFKEHKAPGTIRIFVLGESAALGDPRPAYGAYRYLQTLLRERFSGTQFEIIPAAVTAINSHALVPIAQECVQHDGDVWILYMGNNEMVGPFGATTVLGSRAPPLIYVRFSLAVQSTRLGQLIMTAGRKLAKREPREAGWGGMRMWMENQVPPKDPRKEVIYNNFERNLRRILQTGDRAGVKVLYNTVSVNLRDCAPFASAFQSTPEANRPEFQQRFAAALQAEQTGDFAQATTLLQELAKTEPGFAEIYFRLANLHLRQAEHESARAAFRSARDLDALPFRTDTRMNRILREIRKGANVEFLDAEAFLMTNAVSGVPGRELFHEHVHFNTRGNFALARLWADRVAQMLPESAKRQDRGAWASQSDCERKLGLTDWNQHEVLTEVLSRLGQPPFTNQSDHSNQVAAVRAELRSIRSGLTNQDVAAARQIYVSALQEFPKDHRLRENFGEFLELTGALPDAVAEWEAVRQIIPHHHSGHFNAGRLLMRLGKLPDSEQRLRQALALRPDLAEAWLVLGQVYALKPDPRSALEQYREAQKLSPGDARIYYHMGQALSKLKQSSAAIESFTLALKLRPSFWEARYALGEELAFNGRPAEARTHFEQVLQVNPLYSMAHFNLGVALIELKQYELALHHLDQAQKLDPGNPKPGEYAAKLRTFLKRP